MDTIYESKLVSNRPSWGAVFALALGASALIASEFMPVSLLTPIASDLRVTEGQAGQAIAISGLFAVATSLLISTVAGRIDRKIVLLGLTALMMISGTIVSLAPNYLVFMVGRALIGVVVGGFWSMSAATAMRLVPDHQIPQALAIVNGGGALATVIAAPLGSFLGDIIGWRGAFFCVVPIAAIVFLWQLVSMPSMQPAATGRRANPFSLLKDRSIAWGMVAVSVFFMGQFTLSTYLRPFLESVTRVDVPTLSTVLLIMGIAGFLGTLMIGFFVKRGLYVTLITIPVVMAVLAIGLIVLGNTLAATAALLAAWGMLGTSAPAGWWTWIARSMPKDAEAGGGMMVAVIQVAITLGAAIGGVLYDGLGWWSTFALGAALLVASAFLTNIARVSAGKS